MTNVSEHGGIDLQIIFGNGANVRIRMWKCQEEYNSNCDRQKPIRTHTADGGKQIK